MKTNARASLDVIGSRVLRSVRTLFALKAPDEMRSTYRDLTRLPLVRLSQALEPLCGTAQRVPTTTLGDDVENEAGIEGGRRVGGASVRPPVPAPRTAATPASPGPLLPQLSNGAEAAKVLAAMDALHLKPRAPHANRAGFEQQPQRRSPQGGRAEPDASEHAFDIATRLRDRSETTEEQADASGTQERVAARRRGPADWPLPHLVDTTPAAMIWSEPSAPAMERIGSDRTVRTGMRMARGVPRIAALLQAQVESNDRSEASSAKPVQPVSSSSSVSPKRKAEEPAPANEPVNTALAADLDLLMERLSQELEFDLRRVYGTSEG